MNLSIARSGNYTYYKKVIGNKQFYLGEDRQLAEILAHVVLGEWKRLRAAGVSAWPDDVLSRIEEEKRRLYGRPRIVELGPVRVPPEVRVGVRPEAGVQPVPIPPGPSLSFYGMIDTFRQKVLADPRRAAAWKRELCTRAERLKESLSDRPLDTIRYDELVEVTNYWASCPKGKTGSPISVETAMNYITAARQVFSWAHRTDRWDAPRHFDDIFDLDRRAIARNSGVVSDGVVRVFSVDELRAVWAYLSSIQPKYQPRRKLLMLLALNCGLTQHEMAQLRKAEINLATLHIQRVRYKTGVMGRWKLWPETVKLLASEMNKDASQPLALLTDEGSPLVQYRSDANKTDSVGMAWTRMMRRVHRKHEWVRTLGFKFLRKTGSDLVRRVGGVEMAEAFLSHAERSVSRVYNNRDWERLDECLGQVRVMLDPMFVEENQRA